MSLSCPCHVPVMSLSCPCHLPVISLSSPCHLPAASPRHLRLSLIINHSSPPIPFCGQAASRLCGRLSSRCTPRSPTPPRQSKCRSAVLRATGGGVVRIGGRGMGNYLSLCFARSGKLACLHVCMCLLIMWVPGLRSSSQPTPSLSWYGGAGKQPPTISCVHPCLCTST
jgi:hypothetical protein